MRRLSLSILIPLIVLVIWGVVNSVFFWQTLGQNYQQALATEQHNLQQFSRQIAFVIRHSHKQLLSTEGETDVVHLLDDGSVRRLLLIDSKKKILLDSQMVLRGKKLQPDLLPDFSVASYTQTLNSGALRQVNSDQLQGQRYQLVQWDDENHHIQSGVLYLNYNFSARWQQHKLDLLKHFLMQFGVAVLVVFILAWLLRRWLVNPVLAMTCSADALKQQQHPLGHMVKAHGELGRLYESIFGIGQMVTSSLAKAKQDEQYWQYALTGSGNGVWEWHISAHKMIYSPQWCQLLGLEPDKVEAEFYEWESRIHEDDHDSFRQSLDQYLSGQIREFKHIHRLLNKKGEYIWVLARGQIVEYEGNTPLRMLGTLSNINEYQQTRQQLEFHYSYDDVTGLVNRRRLLIELEKRLQQRHSDHHYGALLYLDVDHFKNVNDLFDHHIGDALLRLIAKRLRKVTHHKGIVARVSGDEFAILLADLGEQKQTAIREALLFANKVRASMVNGFQIRSNEVNLSMTVGIALFPSRQGSAYEIFRQADIALYHGKESGRSGSHFFIEEMATRVHQRHELQLLMRQAMHSHDMVLYYQPRYNDDYQMVGAETLLRWFDSERGWISPGQFIPLAEESGFIVSLGAWIMRGACRALKQWQDRGLPKTFTTLSVNVSPKQFHRSRFVQETLAIIHEEGCDPNLLELEITEGVLVTNIQETIHKIQQLRDIGVRFSVDDFGTGYSSLAYLNQLPINCLKIDKSFVDEVKADGEHQGTIISTIIAMSENLGLDVIAEGVETDYQLQFLKYRGCHIYQGFLFSQALEPDIFEGLLFKDR
ncbi:EAL domain-containing protein [Celerinatantimonas sp. YJH-8]|uniref:bifunctional diguanylate cyclase/phosphodiesterase n=1 Tax=Celerinatantimonas sp. YJH-8 TaxID=3228714 RepID=UPI0038C99BC3